MSNIQRSPDASNDNRSVALHPALQAALIGLDVDLDQELTRYRRQRVLRRQDQTSRSRVVHQTPAPSYSSLTAATASLGAPGLSTTSTITSSAPTPSHPTAEGAIAFSPSSPESSSSSPVNDYLESSEELLRSLVDEPHAPVPETEEEDELEEPGLMATLLTPLGVGSMLLLLLSSATLGYVLLNPSLFRLSSIASLWGGNAPSEVATTPTIDELPKPNLAAEEFVELDLETLSTLPRTGSSPTTSIANPETAIAPSANAENSPAGNTPTIITYLRPTFPVEDPTPASAPTTPDVAIASPSPPTNPTVPSVEPAPNYQPPVESAAPSPAASPSPAPAAPSPQSTPATVSSAPTETNYYYVVTDYSGDASLNTARETVDDAYVRNFPDTGAQVQFGAFSDPARAEELLNELESQGISAEIYRP
jgi:hypothetical protein